MTPNGFFHKYILDQKFIQFFIKNEEISLPSLPLVNFHISNVVLCLRMIAYVVHSTVQ